MGINRRIDMRGIGRRILRPAILLNVVAPLAAYQLLTRRGVSVLDALLLAALFPLVAIGLGVARSRRLDVFGLLSLVAIAFGVAGGLVLRDPHYLLVKDSVVTGLFGLGCLLSLPTRRPLIHLVGRQFVAGTDRMAMDRFDAVLRSPAGLAGARRLTLVWGLALLAEAGIRIALSFALAPGVMVFGSPLLAAAVFGPLALWSIRQRGRTVLASTAGVARERQRTGRTPR